MGKVDTSSAVPPHKRKRGKERVSKEEKEKEVKRRAAIKEAKKEGKAAYSMGVRDDEFKWTNDVLRQAVLWGDALPVTRVRTPEFYGAYVHPKRAMMFMLGILKKKGMLNFWKPGKASMNVWVDNCGMDVQGDGDVPGVQIDRHTSKGTHIRVHNERITLTPLDAAIEVVQDTLMTFPVFNSFSGENHHTLKCIFELLEFSNITEVAGIPIEYYCSVDKHALDALLQFYGDLLSLTDHPPGSLIRWVPWKNVMWDPDHHGPCTFGYMMDATYNCATNPGMFVAEVRKQHKLLKKWDYGERLLWSKLKVVIGWAKDANLKSMAKLKVTIRKTCDPARVDSCLEIVNCYLKMTYALNCQQPTQKQLAGMADWGATMEREFHKVTNGAVPNAVLIWCRKQPVWLLEHKTLYRLRTEGRERAHQRDRESVKHSTQLVDTKITQNTGDVQIERNVIKEWSMWAEGVHSPINKSMRKRANTV